MGIAEVSLAAVVIHCMLSMTELHHCTSLMGKDVTRRQPGALCARSAAVPGGCRAGAAGGCGVACVLGEAKLRRRVSLISCLNLSDLRRGRCTRCGTRRSA